MFFATNARSSGCTSVRYSGMLGALAARSEEHTSELQSRPHLVCRLLLGTEKHTSELHSRPHLVCRLLLYTDMRSAAMRPCSRASTGRPFAASTTGRSLAA